MSSHIEPCQIAAAVSDTPAKRILAVASGGGHWVQLLRISPAWQDHDVAYVTVAPGYRQYVPGRRFYTVSDAHRTNGLRLLRLALKVACIVLRERPDVVVSTGAAPGYFAVRMGKLIGARTVWIDSIANVEELSLSGRRIRRFADLWLTQWPSLARPEGPFYRGAVL
ncbi:MAG: UDP-N-acetylglucosamine--LPS N-acetylglucosamine transferase [Planctomycetes bacterium]|nr:UDP-N-acetylglucosamine--LPS N-acetylglucosamine transferase [Planctomycetota bacterium]